VKFNFTSFFHSEKNKQKAVLLLILLLLLSCCKQTAILPAERKTKTLLQPKASYRMMFIAVFSGRKRKEKFSKKLPHPTIFSMRIYRLLFKF